MEHGIMVETTNIPVELETAITKRHTNQMFIRRSLGGLVNLLVEREGATAIPAEPEGDGEYAGVCRY